MSPEDLTRFEAYFSGGRIALLDRGMTGEAVDAFIGRDDVKQMLRVLAAEATDQKNVERRVKFVANRRLSRMVPTALDVLEKSLEGPQYMRYSDSEKRVMLDANGRPCITEPEPTSLQASTAGQILDRLGITKQKPKTDLYAGEMTLNFDYSSDQRPIDIEYDETLQTEPSQAASRERMRAIMDKLNPLLAQASKEADRRSEKKAIEYAKKRPIRLKANAKYDRKRRPLRVVSRVVDAEPTQTQTQ